MRNPYEKIFKLLAGEDPRALLALFAGIPLDADVEVKPLEREIVAPSQQVDHAYEITDASGMWILHLEATTRYRQEVYERVIRYMHALVGLHWRRVRSYMVVFTDVGFPSPPPGPVELDFAAYRIWAAPEIVRVWEIPASLVLEGERPLLYPWTVLMDASPADRTEAAWRIATLGDDARRIELAILGGLRYGNRVALLDGDRDMTIQELCEESVTYHMLVARDERVRLEGARIIVRRQLEFRFGSLPEWAQTKLGSADLETAERWALQTLTAQSLEEALQ